MNGAELTGILAGSLIGTTIIAVNELSGHSYALLLGLTIGAIIGVLTIHILRPPTTRSPRP